MRMPAMTSMPSLGTMPGMGAPNEAEATARAVLDLYTMPRLGGDPIAVVLFGRRGVGKTTDIVYLGAMQKIRHILAGRRCEVWANFDVDRRIANEVDGYLLEKVMFYDPKYTPRLMDPTLYIIILIDEIQKALPSFRGGSTYNQTFRRLLEDLRKAETEIICATQIVQELDKGLARQLDLYIKPLMFRRWIKGKLITASWLRIWDHWEQFGQAMSAQSRRAWPPDWQPFDWDKILLNVDAVFQFFSSRQIIPPIWSQNRDAMLQAQGMIQAEPEKGDAVMPTETKWPETLDELVAVGSFYVDEYHQCVQRISAKPALGIKGAATWLEAQGFTIAVSTSGHTFAEWKE